jgi:hypothetical protein
MRWPWSREESPPRERRNVCLFLDDSPGAERAFNWAQRNLVDPKRDRRDHASRAAPGSDHAMLTRAPTPI